MKKILIVDDQSEVRELVRVTLNNSEYKIFQAENGKEAVEASRIHHPDLIIMDVMMPGDINGLEATKLIKNDPEMSRVTILMLTAKGQAEDIQIGYEYGADGYFIKPFSPLELMEKVDEILNG